MQGIPDKGFTHGGVFHADDVFSTALLTILNPSIVITRGIELPSDFAGIVFDVGGGPFDHHGSCRKERPNGIPYAAFGLLWKQYGTLLLEAEDAEAFDASFIQPLDDADNGGKPCALAQLVSDFNPEPTGGLVAYDEAFDSAVTWARGVLSRRLEKVRYARKSRHLVARCMEKCDGRVLILSKYVPWKDAVAGSNYELVVYPSVRGGYNIQSVPKNGRQNVSPCLFPAEWRGRDAVELRQISGVSDITFCHPSGFLSSAESLEGAIRVAHLAMEKAGASL